MPSLSSEKKRKMIRVRKKSNIEQELSPLFCSKVVIFRGEKCACEVRDTQEMFRCLQDTRAILIHPRRQREFSTDK